MILQTHHAPFAVAVKFFGACVFKGELWLGSELMAGGSLRKVARVVVCPDIWQFLRKNKGMPWKQKAKLALDVAKAVAQLHSARVLHRDIAARNFLLDDKGDIKITGRRVCVFL